MPKSHVSRFKSSKFQVSILGWYAKNRRVLPWRMAGNRKPDPYKVWLSEIMLQQTTVPAVIPYFQKFTALWPTVGDLAQADDAAVMSAWAGLGYYARARNLLKCAREVVERFKGQFPDTEEALLSLPGIGPYTAAAIQSIAFGIPAIVLDGNIERIISRIFTVETPLPQGKPEIRELAANVFRGIENEGKASVREFPQALMDIGSDICTPRKPKCSLCPARIYCQANKAGLPEKYPVKSEKKKIPTRKGTVYWVRDASGNVIVERRDEKRMLGGMIGLPTSDWDRNTLANQDISEDFKKKIRKLRHIGQVTHVFSHFRLDLDVWTGTIRDVKDMLDSRTSLISKDFSKVQLSEIGFPSLFLKVARLAQKHIE